MRTKFRFRMVRPIDRDAEVLVLIRDTFKENLDHEHSEVLTDEGEWHRYEPLEVLPSNLPAIRGFELQNAEKVKKVLHEWEGRILGVLNERAAPAIDVAHLENQREFSLNTFGPGERTQGVLDHIRKELLEVEAEPDDITEWADVIILALDGALRRGHPPQAIIDAVKDKQERNEARTWPDWRTADPNKAIEHVRALNRTEPHDSALAKEVAR
jgi:hypothetical protein